MVFIAILLALTLERFFDWSHLRRWQWFDRYCQLIGSYVDHLSPGLRLASWVLPPVIIIGIVGCILSSSLFGILRVIFDFIIILYCFGPDNLWAQLYECLQAMQQGDARLVDVRVKAAFPEIAAPTSQALHQSLVRAIFIQGERRVFAVIFWFSIFGPMGAVLYRLTALINSRAIADLALLSNKALEILDWIPARVLGFFFALGGHFVKVFQALQKYALQGLDQNEVLTAETGIAALDLPHNKPLSESGDIERQAVQLFDRALIIMLVLSAVLVLASP